MENEKKIKVVLLEPGKLARATEIDASLAGMQKTVGGLIEPFYPFEEQVCIVCNEESKINGMRPNRSVKNDDGVMVDALNEMRNDLLEEERPTDIVDEVLLKVIDAPAKKVRCRSDEERE